MDPCDDPGGVAGTVVPELLVAPPSLVAAVEGFPAMLPRCAYLVSFPLASAAAAAVLAVDDGSLLLLLFCSADDADVLLVQFR